jgi:hypothetical protein
LIDVDEVANFRDLYACSPEVLSSFLSQQSVSNVPKKVTRKQLIDAVILIVQHPEGYLQTIFDIMKNPYIASIHSPGRYEEDPYYYEKPPKGERYKGLDWGDDDENFNLDSDYMTRVMATLPVYMATADGGRKFVGMPGDPAVVALNNETEERQKKPRLGL